MLGRKILEEKRKSCDKRAVINVSKIVKDACSVYIEKGRYHSTASKLSKTRNKCTRIAR
jgi:hypothetical protein